MFEHRRRLARDGVLVVGPNRAFLDYIANVLPSLGERSVRQCTVADLCVPKVEITGVDDPATAARKGSAALLGELAAAALASGHPATRRSRRAARCPPPGVHRGRDRRVARACCRCGDPGQPATTAPAGDRRAGAAPPHWPRRRVVGRRSPQAGARPGMADAESDPARRPLPRRTVRRQRGRRRAWTVADQLLVDEANSILNGPPFTYGHVVVDEAQDHSAVALRVIGRRSPDQSMTLVGDVAQSTAPGGQERWDDVFDALAPSARPARPGDAASGDVAVLEHRVPRPRADPRSRPTACCRSPVSTPVPVAACAPAPPPPRWTRTDATALDATVATVVAEVKHRHRLTGVVAPPAGHGALAAALARARPRRRRPRPPARPRRRAAVRTRAGQGPRVRRGRRRRAGHDLRRHAAGCPAAVRGDDASRAGARRRDDCKH